MKQQFTNEKDRMEAFFKLPGKILLQKNSIGYGAVKNLNQFFKGKLDSTKPNIIEDIEREAILETKAAHPAGTFNSSTPVSLQVKKDGLAFIEGDILEFDGMLLMINSVVSDTEIKCILVGIKDIDIPNNTALKNAGNSSIEGEVGNNGRGITVPRRNYNYTTIVKTRKHISRSYATDRKWTTDNAVAELRNQGLAEFARELEKTIMSPVRHEAKSMVNGKQVIRRYTGGIPFFIRNLFNEENGEVTGLRTDNVFAVNGAISMTYINKGFKYAIKKGGKMNTLSGSVDTIGSLADLEKDKINLTLLNGSNALEVGGGLKILKSPIDVDGNKIDAIFITDELSQGEMLMYDRGAVSFEVMENSLMFDETKPNPKDDNFRFNASVEGTVVVKNAGESFVLFTGITY